MQHCSQEPCTCAHALEEVQETPCSDWYFFGNTSCKYILQGLSPSPCFEPCILPCCLVNKNTHYFLHVSFHLNRQSLTLTQMMMWLNMVALKWWSLQFANNDTSWSNNFLIIFHSIWFQKLLLWNQQVMKIGLSLWNYGRLPKKWYVLPKNELLLSTLYFATPLTCILYEM